MKNRSLISSIAALVAACGIVGAQPQPSVVPDASEAEVMSEPIPPQAVVSAVDAVAKLGEQVVLGRYNVAIERMNPVWKERTAARLGGMEKLEKQLEGVAAQMMQQGVSMISSKPQGQPRAYEVSPVKKTIKENGKDVERLVYSRLLVFVPTVTRYRILQQGNPKPFIIESTGFQVAISEKGKNDWTFIDGSGLKTSDLRGMFITLPKDIELPEVKRREVR